MTRAWTARFATTCLTAVLLTACAVPVTAARADDIVDPHRLLLTWQRDPTSTMTIQWLMRAAFLPAVENEAPEPRPHDVPYVGDVTIDAAGDDWWDAGLAITFLADENHQLPADEADLTADARLAWNEDGLLLLVRVRDSVAVEMDEPSMFWSGDGLEIFVADAVGSDYRYQVAVTPGTDPDHDAPRHNFYPKDGGPAADDLTIQHAARTSDDGYILEVLLPWSNLPELEVDRGTQFGFQFYVNDRDGDDAYQSLGIHPARNASGNADVAYAFRLADDRGTPIQTRAEVRETEDALVVSVHGRPELAGRTVAVRSGDEDLAAAALEPDGRRASVELTLPDPPEGRRWGRLEVVLDDATSLATIETPAGVGAIEPGPVELAYWPADDPDAADTLLTNVARIEAWPGQFRHRVEIVGLEPDTAYRFKAVGDNVDHGFRTMPVNLDRPLRIAVGGDVRHNQTWMERTNRVAMTYEPDFIVWGGDLAYANGREDLLHHWEEWFDAVGNTLIDDDGYVVPIIVAIGNHEVQGGFRADDPDFQNTDEWRLGIAPYFYQFFAFPGHPGYGVLDFGDYLSIVLLDTGHANPIAGEQTEWLSDVLARRADVPHVIPVYHVPGYPTHRPARGGAESSVRENWMPLFEQYGVRLAFENHDHTYKRTHPIRAGELHPDGVVYIGDGAWGVGVRELHNVDAWYIKRAESQRHAIILTLHGTHQHVLVVNDDGQVIDEYPDTGRVDAAE
ncbi:MAG: sugar-binding protein [Phycisphaeraceae bacterium]